MTAVRAPRTEPAATGPLTGTGALLRLVLRRDRFKLPAWVVGLGLYVVYVTGALPTIAGSEDELAALAPLLSQPVGRMFAGPAYGMDDLSYERFFAGGYVLYLFVLAAVMSILLVTRHTRAEEESGRSELVRAAVVGRHAQLTAALLGALLANLASLVVVAALAAAAGYSTAGSLLVGAATALVGTAFAGVTAVTVQLTEHARSASGMAFAALGATFLLRALGDMAALGGSSLSWASPLGWASQTAPYVLDRWWPLLPLLALTATTVAAAFLLQARRDLGAGLLAAAHGPARARAALGTPLGLAVRLQRGTLVGWGVAIVLLGVVDGAFTQELVDSAEDMPEALGQVFGTEQMRDGYLAFLAMFVGYVTAAYVVNAVQGLRSEETAGRGEAVLATATSRTAWAGSHLVVVAAGTLIILAVTGAATALAVGGVTGDWAMTGAVVAAHLNVLPALLLLLGLCGLLHGWRPALLAPVGWAVVGLMALVGLFADLLDLPQWLRQLSPISHVAQLPVEEFSATPLLVLTALAVLAAGAGLVGLNRRQVEVR